MLAAIALGLGLFFASFSTRYRDLNHLVGFGVLLLMYASPVIYPTSFVPDSLLFLFSFNPVAPVLEGFKAGLFGLDFSNWWGLFYSFCFALGSLLVGLMAFHRVEGKFVDFV
jgi:lipopolysaccharide transport system permease protein